MYIDHVIYFNRKKTVNNPNEHTVLYVLRAPGPNCSMYYLSGTNKNIKYIYKYINLKAFIYLFKFNKGVYYKVFNKYIKNIKSIKVKIIKY